MVSAVVLGLQGTVDYELEWDAAIVETAAAEHALTAADLAPDVPVVDERSLLCSLLAHMREGTGGERFVASSALVERFAERFTKRVTLGGTCVRAALAMRVRGVGSLVHLVSTDENVRRLLPANCRILSSAAHDTLDPHLIVQYPAGARVRLGGDTVVSPHPNRLIFANDPPARALVLSPELGEQLIDAEVFLISGLNSIQERRILEARLGALEGLIARVPSAAVVMFEEAGYHRVDFGARVREVLAPLVDVYSMNEDELQQAVGHRIDLLNADEVGSALDEVLAGQPHPVHVVHTKYWAIALGDGAHRFVDAVRGGVAMASARYLVGDGVSAKDEERVRSFPRHPGGEAVVRALENRRAPSIAGVAGFVLDTDRPVTIGLGDAFVGGFLAALVRKDHLS